MLSCPLNEGTRNLVDRSLIELMPSEDCGRHLVNVARGGVAVESDIASLFECSLTSYATDVFAEEPCDKGGPCLAWTGFSATPHVGAATREAQDAVDGRIVV